MQKHYREKNECRVCGSQRLVKYFDFGPMPLVNHYVSGEDKEAERIPLAVMFCEDCANSQLSVVVDPNFLFSNYLYHSSVSKTFQEHCAAMALDIQGFLGKRDLKCLDIASNDGCLLKEFKKKGYATVGVDPAQNLCEIARSEGIRTICSLWGDTAADQVIRELGKVDVVTATNVFAHVDDIHGFVAAVSRVLTDDGVFVVEFPYMRNLIEFQEFDTIYHEHVSYFLVHPLVRLFEKHHMKICDIRHFPELHGGSLRLHVLKDKNKTTPRDLQKVKVFLKSEAGAGLHVIEPYRGLEPKAQKIRADFVRLLDELGEKNQTIAGYGASAKGNIFVNFCGIDEKKLLFIVDDTTAKQGFYSPGTKIPIVPRQRLYEERPDYLVILAWNFAEEIMRNTRKFHERGGKYIIAIPELHVV